MFDPDKMPDALAVVRSVVSSHGLGVSYDGEYVAISNSVFLAIICEVDRGTTSWEFVDRRRSGRIYNFGDFEELILGLTRKDVWESIVLTRSDRPAGDLELIARVIVTYLQGPISGDYSWHDEYVRRIRYYTRYWNFADDPPSDLDPRGKEVVERLQWRREGWKAAADAYFAECWPEGGWEFADSEAEVLRSRLRC